MSRRQRARTRYETERGAMRARAHRHYARVRRRNETRGRRQLLGGLAFVGAFGLGLAASTSDATFGLALFAESEQRVEYISVVGHERISADEIAALAGVEPGTAPGDVDLALSAERVRHHPWVRTARVRHTAGGELLVVVEERKLAALLHSAGVESWRAVEADGTPFSEIDPAAHPELLRLRGGASFVNSEPQPRVAEALELGRRLEEHGIPRPAAIVLPVDDGDLALQALGWRLTLADGGPVVVLGREPDDARLARLAELLATQHAAVRSAERIDMRFRDRAILRAARAIPAESIPASREATPGTLTARLGGRPASG